MQLYDHYINKELILEVRGDKKVNIYKTIDDIHTLTQSFARKKIKC